MPNDPDAPEIPLKIFSGIPLKVFQKRVCESLWTNYQLYGYGGPDVTAS
jgi:hypothetical protein